MTKSADYPYAIPRGGRIDESKPFKPVRIAILSASDTRSLAEDSSGDALVARLEAAGHSLADRKLTSDDISAIRCALSDWIAREDIDVILTTGGTGLTGRDGMPEAVRPLLDKEMEGFSVIWHMLSFQTVGLSTMQSRALAGVAQGTFVFCLPGSTGACCEAWDGIIALNLDNRHRPCNLVEIMPRLMEN